MNVYLKNKQSMAMCYIGEVFISGYRLDNVGVEYARMLKLGR